MISYEKFAEKFSTTDDFEKAYPVRKKITWYDRLKYTIVGYQTDTQFKNKDDFYHLVVMKCWSKYKQRWCYSVVGTYVFYATVEIIERALKEERKVNEKKKKHKTKTE